MDDTDGVLFHDLVSGDVQANFLGLMETLATRWGDRFNGQNRPGPERVTTMWAPPDTFHLEAAKGWLDLGDHVQANAELERITARLRAHPDVLDLRWQIHAKAKKWDACAEIAEAIIQLAPARADGWVHRSIALHELGRTQEAFDNLLPVAYKFPAVWTLLQLGLLLRPTGTPGRVSGVVQAGNGHRRARRQAGGD